MAWLSQSISNLSFMSGEDLRVPASYSSSCVHQGWGRNVAQPSLKADSPKMATGVKEEVLLFPPIPLLSVSQQDASDRATWRQFWKWEWVGRKWEFGMFSTSSFEVSHMQLLVLCLLAATSVSTSSSVGNIIKKTSSEDWVEVLSPLLLWLPCSNHKYLVFLQFSIINMVRLCVIKLMLRFASF